MPDYLGLLRFDPQAHAYEYAGRPVAGVTRALEPFNGLEYVDPDLLAAAALFGQHVHEAIHLLNIGELELSSLSTAVAAYVCGWERFLEESGFVVVESEARVYHPTLGYAGQLDNVGQFPKHQELALVDIKTGETMPKTVGPQTAAYSEAWAMMHGRRRLRRYCCVVGPDSYKLFPLTDPKDFDIFKAALTLHRWQRGI